MDLIPKSVIVGVFSSIGVPGSELTRDAVNRIWADVAGTYLFTQLQMAPDGSAATFIGSGQGDGVVIQPPLIQVTDSLSGGSITEDRAAEKAREILTVIARHLHINEFFNLGVRHVYNVPVPDHDGRGFVLHRVLGKSEEDLSDLRLSGGIWAGIKYVVSYDDGTYTLLIEPLLADDFQSLYLDLDAQFPGPTTPDAIPARAAEAAGYIKGSVNRYLDRLQALGGGD